MEQRREVQIGREAQRREAETADPERRERLGVGATGHQIRHGTRTRILGAQRGTHRVDQLTAELATAQRKQLEGTKFAKLGRWRAASLLYVVAEPGVAGAHEIPDGWGLLEREGDGLVLRCKPCLNPTTAAERVALLERIAAAGRTLS